MSTVRTTTNRPAYTIIELLTVMSIIVILIGLLVPALNKARIFAFKVRQKVQIRNIDTGLTLFEAEMDSIPDSDEEDITNESYCGAMKLAEAMLGQDLLGFHPDSLFRRDGLADPDGDGTDEDLYPLFGDPPVASDKENMKERKGPFVALENANGYYLDNIYSDLGVFAGGEVPIVMCDVYKKVNHRITGQRIGMPILFYRADNSKNSHDLNWALNPDNIYDYQDNDELVQLGLPWEGTGLDHPQCSSGNPTSTGGMSDPLIFYEITRNKKVTSTDRPYNEGSYIIQSAGYDGEYGTSDDIFNFGN